jgi:hypothetical protein
MPGIRTPTCFHAPCISPHDPRGSTAPTGACLRASAAMRRGSGSSRRSSPPAVIEEVKKSNCAAAAARASRPGSSGASCRAVSGAEVPRLQFRRGRAGHLQGPRHPALQPAHRDRGHGHRRLRDGRDRRLQLHPRRDLGRVRALRGGARRGARRRLLGEQHPRLGFRLPAARPPRLRRLHLRRGDRAARVARGQEGPAALQAAVPGQLRPVRQADHDQQHRDLRRGAVDHQPRRRWFLELGKPNNGGTKIFSVSGDVERPGNYEVPLGTPFAKAARAGRRHARRRKLKA